jgi:PAS domain S-box-containing protein
LQARIMNSEDRRNSDSFLNSFEQLFFLTDLAGDIFDITPYTLQKLGFSREEIVGRPMLVMHPSERRDEVLRQFKAIIARHTDRYAIPLVTSNGDVVPAETHVTRGIWNGKNALFFLCRDIAERVRLGEVLRETEARFQALADCAPVMLWTTNENFACLFFNQTWLDFTGRTLEQEISVGWTASLHPDDFHSCLNACHSAMQARRPFEIEFRFKRCDGEYRWLLGSGKPRFVNADAFVGYVGAFVDVTERRRSEATLHATQAQLESVIQLSSDAIVCTDETQRITLFNESAEIMFGYEAAEVLGATLDILLPERFAADHHRHVQRFAESPLVVRRIMHERAPVSGRRKDGSEFLAEASISKSVEGDVGIFTVQLRNVSERRQAHEERLYHLAALRKIQEAVVVTDARFSVVLWNPGAERIFGWTERETLGRDVRSILRVSGNDDGEKFWRNILERGELSREGAVYSRPGRELSIVLSASPVLESDGVTVGVLVVCRETMARRESEQRGRHSERSEEIGRLAFGLAHEIRNPVAIIARSLAAAKHSGVPSEIREEMLDIAVQEAKRLERLAGDFLSYARPSPPQKRPTSPRSTLNYVIAVLKARAAQEEISLSSECQEDHPISIDAFQMHQALLNLASNALDAVSKSGSVFLRGASEEKRFLFSVENSGDAIPDAETSRIFEPFFTTKPKGAGLGLSIAQNIVRAHGGDISLTSNHAGCVRFTVILPR